MRDKGEVFEQLINLAYKAGCSVKFVPFRAHDGMLKGDRIGIRQGLSIDDINYNLAHELAHAFLHYDKGKITSDAIPPEMHEAYEEQADRAANLLLCAVGANVVKRGEVA